MIGVCSCALYRTENPALKARGSCALLLTALYTKIHQSHQPGTVRHLNIRRVVTKKKPSEGSTIKKSISESTISNQVPEEKATVSQHDRAEKRSLAVEYHHYLGRIDVDKWRSRLVLPPDTYWEKWRHSLKTFDAGGLDTAVVFVERWKDTQPRIKFIAKNLVSPDAGHKRVFACIAQISLALLGVREVVSYGYTQQEAFDNQGIARVSMLYQSGELDTIYQGTIASRKFMAIYEQTAKYGLFPKFDITMTDDQPDPQFQLTLAIPKWELKATATAPTYIEALSEVVKIYDEAKKDGVKIPLTSEATSARLDILSFKTASRALKFLTEKMQAEEVRRWRQKLRTPGTPGPPWMYRVAVKGCYDAQVPMLRDLDAHFVGTITAVVRILQRFGFNLIDGFEEHLEATKYDADKKLSSKGEEEVGIAGHSDKSSL
ncbi:hypothetical protein QM012_009497 [Aureobasidium pullulans]|uniref:Uncharacterized protein n=1 Tax=Aureobasidium pullulans TaxID=5580 RepID=A0ABR0TII6_AURPU